MALMKGNMALMKGNMALTKGNMACNPQKAHLHPLRDVCVQYENNPANALWDIVRKLNLSSAIN